MKRIVLGLGLAVIAIGLAVALATALLGRIYFTPERLERLLAGSSGRNVEIDGPVEVSFWGEPRVTVFGLHLKNPPRSSFKHLATLDSISVSLRWWDLFAAMATSHPHFLDLEVRGGKVHVDSRQDVVGSDGVWPSADDPFTQVLGWIDALEAHDLALEIQAGGDRIHQIHLNQIHMIFDTGKDEAVIINGERLDLTIEDFPVQGSLKLIAPIVLPGKNPPASLVGALKIAPLDLTQLFDRNPSPDHAPTLDQPLPFRECVAWDTDIAVSVAAVRIEMGNFSDLEFEIHSKQGHWTVQLVKGDFPAGQGHGEVSLQCGQRLGKLALKTQVRSGGADQFGHSGASIEILGRMESLLQLAGQGNTWKDILDDLSGRFAVFLGPVETAALEDRLYAEGLYHALTVSWGQPEKAVVDCAVLDMSFNNGVGRSQHIVISTPNLVINGVGEVNLIKDKIDFVLIPYAKHLHLGKVHIPVRISGSIQKPQVGLDWEDVLQRLGIETLAALFDPILPVLSFDGRLAKEELEACRRSLAPLNLPKRSN